MRHTSRLLVAIILACGPALAGCAREGTSTAAPQTSDQQVLVDKARVAVEELRTDRVVGPAVNDALRNSRGVLIFPNLVRAGLGVGAGAGTGTLLGRTAPGGGWSDPAFYLAAEGSFGLQIGAEAGRVMFVVRNDGALVKIVDGSVNLGVDVSVAVGPVGAGAAGASTPALGADLIAFSVQSGLFGGATIRGGVVSPRIAWNEAYYGPGATPRLIVIENRFHNPGAVGLKQALAVR
jgi:lipid-binding SYLF domain-containing protein